MNSKLSTQSLPKISEDFRMKILLSLRDKLSGTVDGKKGKIVFRRVASVKTHSKVTYFRDTFAGGEVVDYKSINHKNNDMHKNIVAKCNSFECTTLVDQMRDESLSTLGKVIKFQSFAFTEFDTDLNLSKTIHRSQHRVPYVGNRIAKIAGDIICMWFSNDTIAHLKKNPKNIPFADKWFIASEQFLRAWTCIMYDWHDSFDTLIPKNTPVEDREKALFDKLFINNRLMTNSFRKLMLAHEAEGKQPFKSEAEMIEKYYARRTEDFSEHVDNYPAMVLIARYGYLPCFHNVPNTKDNGPKRVSWDLRQQFVSTILKCGISNIHDSESEFISLENLNDYSSFSSFKERVPLEFFEELSVSKPMLSADTIPTIEIVTEPKITVSVEVIVEQPAQPPKRILMIHTDKPHAFNVDWNML